MFFINKSSKFVDGFFTNKIKKPSASKFKYVLAFQINFYVPNTMRKNKS
jgi:hypothetical protein